MSTMNISLPDELKSFVDEQVSGRGFGTSSEYVRGLIRKDQDRLHLRGLLLEGGGPKPPHRLMARTLWACVGVSNNIAYRTANNAANNPSPRPSPRASSTSQKGENKARRPARAGKP